MVPSTLDSNIGTDNLRTKFTTNMLSELISSRQWKIINNLRYKALRCAIDDFRNRTLRLLLDQTFKRATPLKWMHYSSANLVIALYNYQNRRIMTTRLRDVAYINDVTGSPPTPSGASPCAEIASKELL